MRRETRVDSGPRQVDIDFQGAGDFTAENRRLVYPSQSFFE